MALSLFFKLFSVVVEHISTCVRRGVRESDGNGTTVKVNGFVNVATTTIDCGVLHKSSYRNDIVWTCHTLFLL